MNLAQRQLKSELSGRCKCEKSKLLKGSHCLPNSVLLSDIPQHSHTANDRLADGSAAITVGGMTAVMLPCGGAAQ